MNENIFRALIAFVGFLGAILTYVIVPFLKSKQGEITSRMTDSQLSQIKFWTEMAVIAVEKQFENKHGEGPIKKEHVIDFVKDNISLNKYITNEQLEILVDAVVEELINKS